MVKTNNKSGLNKFKRSWSGQQSPNKNNTEITDNSNQNDASNCVSKEKKNHRHSQVQIRTLELYFSHCPHPDEKQREELAGRIGLDYQQVKFWFQNRRTELKKQLGKHENAVLRLENDKLRIFINSGQYVDIRSKCVNCGHSVGISSGEQHAPPVNNNNTPNIWPNQPTEVFRTFIPQSPYPNLNTGDSSSSPAPIPIPMPAPINTDEVGLEKIMAPPSLPIAPQIQPNVPICPPELSSMYFELGTAAIEELVKLVLAETNLWTKNIDDPNETLNFHEYNRTYPRIILPKPSGFASEGTRASTVAMINGTTLVEILMDVNRWCNMFSNSVVRGSTTNVISNGSCGTRHLALQLIQAEFQILSPLVPVREANFLRMCKQLSLGVWVVVDVSIPGTFNSSLTASQKLPSGCVIQDFPNGQSKITWVEHSEYDEKNIHESCRSMVSSGAGLGAKKWVYTLKRQCQTLDFLIYSSFSNLVVNGLTEEGFSNLLKLAHRMTLYFYQGACPSLDVWNELSVEGLGSDVRVLSRKCFNLQGQSTGIILNGTRSVWLPVSHAHLFEYLRDEKIRSEWDILSNQTPMHEVAFVTKDRDSGNRISLIHTEAVNESIPGMLLIQETTTDESGSLVVYAPVDIPTLQGVIHGGDPDGISLLSSGFSIIPNTVHVLKNEADRDFKGKGKKVADSPDIRRIVGSVLTMTFQILVIDDPNVEMPADSLQMIKTLLVTTLEKIKAAMVR